MASGHDWTEVIVPDVVIVPVLIVLTLQGLRLNAPLPGFLRV